VASALFRASVRGAGKLSRAASRGAGRVDRFLRDEMDPGGTYAEDATDILWDAAPKDTQRLADSIHAGPADFATRIGATFFAEAIDPDTGYDYTGVTRFGHRVATIEPTRRRAIAYESGRGPVVAAHVPGYDPGLDWVDLARADLDHAAGEASERVGRKVDTRLLR
jgi:hypothetical protein